MSFDNCDFIFYYIYRVAAESSFQFLKNLFDMKDHTEMFSAEKPDSFCMGGIFKLCERWRKVVEQNGTYIIR